MTRRHRILQTLLPAMEAAALAVSPASAMPARDVDSRAAKDTTNTSHAVLLPGLIDAAAHAATIRGIGAALLERARA
jgi:hypothetical protein